MTLARISPWRFAQEQLLRKHSPAAKLPIIALTAKAMPDDRQRCLDAGAHDYITTPIDIDKLSSLLRIWLPPHRL